MCKILKQLQHSLNPLHVYSNLVKRGFTKAEAMILAQVYEGIVYATIIEPEIRRCTEETENIGV